MSARDVIAATAVEGKSEPVGDIHAAAILAMLTAAGYRILGPDDLAVKARPLDDWHEDDGDVVWWCWRDGAWLGESAYIGSPIDLGQTVECHTHALNGETPAARFLVGGWPGYHTHWTPHPTFPPVPEAPQPEAKEAPHD